MRIDRKKNEKKKYKWKGLYTYKHGSKRMRNREGWRGGNDGTKRMGTRFPL